MQIINFYPKKIEESLSMHNICAYKLVYIYIYIWVINHYYNSCIPRQVYWSKNDSPVE